MDENSHDHSQMYGSLGLLAYRLVWMVLGPMTVTVTSVMIVVNGTGWLTGLDVAFLFAVLVTLGARWASYLSGDLSDDSCQPTTTPLSMRRYTVRLVVVAFLMWAVANALGNHLLK